MFKLMKDIKINIERELKKKKLTKEFLARQIGFADSSGLINALKFGRLRVSQFLEICHVLEVQPTDLLPGHNELRIFDMPLLDLFRHICKQEIMRYLDNVEKYKGENEA